MCTFICRYKLLMKKTPLEIMKLKLLTTNVDIAQHIVNCASPGSRLASRKLPNMNNLPLFLIRQFLLVSLLRELLMLPRHELQRLILKKPEICNRPISHIQKTASFLFAVIKLTAKQVRIWFFFCQFDFQLRSKICLYYNMANVPAVAWGDGGGAHHLNAYVTCWLHVACS